MNISNLFDKSLLAIKGYRYSKMMLVWGIHAWMKKNSPPPSNSLYIVCALDLHTVTDNQHDVWFM